jgi:hypothetical protein
MPSGIPGELSRRESATLEAERLGAEDIPFGAAVKLADGLVAPIASGDAASAVYGFLVRPYPTMGIAAGMTSEPGPGSAPAGSIQSVMRRGYMTVLLKGATAAAKNGAVYVRVTAASGKYVGDIEAAADSGKTVAVTGCIFMGAADSGGNVEISFNI